MKLRRGSKQEVLGQGYLFFLHKKEYKSLDGKKQIRIKLNMLPKSPWQAHEPQILNILTS